MVHHAFPLPYGTICHNSSRLDTFPRSGSPGKPDFLGAAGSVADPSAAATTSPIADSSEAAGPSDGHVCTCNTFPRLTTGASRQSWPTSQIMIPCSPREAANRVLRAIVAGPL
eukprot:scaffold3514_cov132-Isochrysis_galbana.AAC.1